MIKRLLNGSLGRIFGPTYGPLENPQRRTITLVGNAEHGVTTSYNGNPTTEPMEWLVDLVRLRFKVPKVSGFGRAVLDEKSRIIMYYLGDVSPNGDVVDLHVMHCDDTIDIVDAINYIADSEIYLVEKTGVQAIGIHIPPSRIHSRIDMISASSANLHLGFSREDILKRARKRENDSTIK